MTSNELRDMYENQAWRIATAAGVTNEAQLKSSICRHFGEALRLATENAVLGVRADVVTAFRELWDEQSVQCGNCGCQILKRGGSIQHAGLSVASGEDLALCGYCLGMEAAEQGSAKEKSDKKSND